MRMVVMDIEAGDQNDKGGQDSAPPATPALRYFFGGGGRFRASSAVASSGGAARSPQAFGRGAQRLPVSTQPPRSH
jgi:hypothetical protein